MGYKRLIGFAIIFCAIAGILIYTNGHRHSDSDKVLRICTWSNYFPDSILAAFTSQTGIRIEHSYMSSNEELFSKLKAGAAGFDIIQPSDYMVHQLIALGMLSALRIEAMPNLKHIEDRFRNLPYDPELKFSVPFAWGTDGIAVNTGKVTVPDSGISWKFLLDSPDPKHTSMLDDMREAFAAVLISQGEEPNTSDISALNKARARLGSIKDHILMFTSEPKPLLLREELTIAHAYSTDAIQAGLENPKIKFFIPTEGAIIWTDNFAIPTASRHVDEAYRFINYFLDPNNALMVVKQTDMATPNKATWEMLPAGKSTIPAYILGRRF